MFRLTKGLPPDVIAIEAIGKVTHRDYRDVLIPRIDAMAAKGRVKMLYVIGDECTGFELEALWDDGALGVRHWRDFSRIAVVTNHAPLRAMVTMFQPFFHGEVRLFALAALSDAEAWIGGATNEVT